MLLPVFAPLVLKEYNDKNQKKLPNTLEEAGVTVVNINGINFKYFYPLFCDIDKNEDRICCKYKSKTFVSLGRS